MRYTAPVTLAALMLSSAAYANSSYLTFGGGATYLENDINQSRSVYNTNSDFQESDDTLSYGASFDGYYKKGDSRSFLGLGSANLNYHLDDRFDINSALSFIRSSDDRAIQLGAGLGYNINDVTLGLAYTASNKEADVSNFLTSYARYDNNGLTLDAAFHKDLSKKGNTDGYQISADYRTDITQVFLGRANIGNVDATTLKANYRFADNFRAEFLGTQTTRPTFNTDEIRLGIGYKISDKSWLSASYVQIEDSNVESSGFALSYSTTTTAKKNAFATNVPTLQNRHSTFVDRPY